MELETRAAAMRQAAVDREKARRKRERAMEVLVQAEENRGSGKRGGGPGADEDAMDIDQEGGSGRTTRGLKRGASGLGSFGGLGRRSG